MYKTQGTMDSNNVSIAITSATTSCITKRQTQDASKCSNQKSSSSSLGIMTRRRRKTTFLFTALLISVSFQCYQNFRSNRSLVLLSSTTTSTTATVTYGDKKLQPQNVTKITTKSSSSATSTTKSNVTKPQPQDQGFHPVAIDILSIASKTRIDYVLHQKAFMIRHLAVRNFYYVTEDDDVDQQCIIMANSSSPSTSSGSRTRDEQLQDIQGIQQFCKHRNFLDTGDRFSYADGAVDFNKYENPLAWYCAQTRPAIGLTKILKGYVNESNSSSSLDEDLPDWLLIMDDDTYVNVDKVVQTILKSNYTEEMSNNPISGYIFARGESYHFPHGGYGIFIPRSILKQLLQPVANGASMNIEFLTTELQKDNIYSQLEKNLILELSKTPKQQPQLEQQQSSSSASAVATTTIQDMKLVDILYHIATNQPFSDYQNWKDGYCFHSDWLWGYLFKRNMYFSSSSSLSSSSSASSSSLAPSQSYIGILPYQLLTVETYNTNPFQKHQKGHPYYFSPEEFSEGRTINNEQCFDYQTRKNTCSVPSQLQWCISKYSHICHNVRPQMMKQLNFELAQTPAYHSSRQS